MHVACSLLLGGLLGLLGFLGLLLGNLSLLLDTVNLFDHESTSDSAHNEQVSRHAIEKLKGLLTCL